MKHPQLWFTGAGIEGLVEQNCHMHNEVRGGSNRDGRGVSEDESKINEVAEDLGNAIGRDVAPPNGHSLEQVQQQPPLPPPGPIISWETILPVRSLKVLLVEYDDSTRQVVSALLRNCSYEVVAVSNGFEAWNILEDFMNNINLVLTEVAMPGLSGIGLLNKIMTHKTCKNIPVIMMSSNDSMGVAFKCLSKGAADFLVKPIRKNELKNLWQHVWRRCHSRQRSESRVQNQKSLKSKSADDSDNNTDSTDEEDNGSIGLNTRDGSDHGSGTQSSWTKHAVDVDSPQQVSPSDHVADRHDSICALVIHPISENFCSQWAPMSPHNDFKKQKEHNDDHIMGKDLAIGMPNLDTQNISSPADKLSTSPMGVILEDSHKKDQSKAGTESHLEHEHSKVSHAIKHATDFSGGIIDASNADLRGRETDSNGFYKTPNCEEKIDQDEMEMPSLELSLKRLRPSRELNNDRSVLRHSDHSAFTRYNRSAASNQGPTGFGGNCSIPIVSCSEAVKTDSRYNNMISSSNAAPLRQGSDGSSNNNDVGSTTKNPVSKPATFKDKITATSIVSGVEPCSFHSSQHQTSGSQQVTQEKRGDVDTSTLVGQPPVLKHEVQVQHHHHHYHHHHHHLHKKQQQQPDQDGSSLKDFPPAAAQCRSSNVLGGPKEGIAANFSVNGSTSESNHRSKHESNGQNGSSVAVNTAQMNMDSDTGVGERSGSGGTESASASGSGSRSGLASNRSTQREAALNKFRQKRKERNFGKKVRYQSRKKLAEQRPRIRGQFVKQTAHEDTSRKAES